MDAIWTELYNAAKEVQKPRQISDYVSGGEVPQPFFQKVEKSTLVFALTPAQLWESVPSETQSST